MSPLFPPGARPRGHQFARRTLPFQSMTLNQFKALPEDQQLAAVYATGTYVARR